jgi:hypothetical protein
LVSFISLNVSSFGDGQTISFAFSTLASNSLESLMESNEMLSKDEMISKLLKFLEGKGFDALKSLVIITQRVGISKIIKNKAFQLYFSL